MKSFSLSLVAAVFVLALSASDPNSPALSQEISVAGLKQPVEILKDRWGVAHIYAGNAHDLFFAQGYNAAADRLWQMEMWRRAGEGSLAAVTGLHDLPRDRFARLMKYRGDLETEYRSYAPDAREIIEAFVSGVNNYMDSHRGQWPVEFQLTGIEPQHWTPEACLLRMAGYVMTRNASTEVLRARLISKLGAKRTEEILPTDPYQRLEVPPGLDLSGIDEKILAGSGSDIQRLDFSQSRSRTWQVNVPLLHPYFSEIFNPDLDGSNNWTVSGALTQTGRPILANDPHRTIANPSLRYLVHLYAPGWNVIGAGESALPGVAAGHNDRIAFGFTIVGIDQQDLYVYETAPENPGKYRYRGEWVDMTSSRETFAVKDTAPVTEELLFTRHGPVLFQDKERHRAYALRWIGTEPGSAGYLASLSLDRARNWREFLAALERWKVPSENIVYADVDGNIGWHAAGAAPIRKGWYGLLPVPGNGDYEWQGFLPLDQLPRKYNPKEGFIATANHKIIPAGYPHAINFEWSAPYRFQRIEQILKSRDPLAIRTGTENEPAAGTGVRKFSNNDFKRLQHDVLSLPAIELIAALRQTLQLKKRDGGWAASGDEAIRALMEVAGWDGVLAKDSRAALLYEVWSERLPALFFQSKLPSDVWRLAGNHFRIGDVIDLLKLRRPGFSCPDREETAELMRRAMREALTDLTKHLGADRSKWMWGALHKAEFRHSLSGFGGSSVNFDLPSASRSGDATTVNATGGTNFKQTSGASFREIIDLSDWDRSVTINTPGQSSVPGTAHYGDLLPLWEKGEYFPMLFTRAKVEAAATERLLLRPSQ